MTTRLFLHSTRRVLKADIVAFEAVVRKMSLECAQVRGKDKGVTGSSGGGHSSGSGGGSSGLAAAGASAVGKRPAAETADPLAGAQDEWVLLNALTLVEYESE